MNTLHTKGEIIDYMNENCDTALEILRSNNPHIKKFLSSKSIAMKAANMEINLDVIVKFCGKKFANDLDICKEVIISNTQFGRECIVENLNAMSIKMRQHPTIQKLLPDDLVLELQKNKPKNNKRKKAFKV